jgi:tetratricopeptide (TPR) repeat protein
MNRTLIIFFLLSLTVGLTTPLRAQQERSRAQEYRMQQEQIQRAALLRLLDSAIVLMDDGLYAEADEKFRHVLNNIKSVPSDLTFYFGKNSFYLQKYKQSIDWLNKYIQLKGTSGQFSNEAVMLLKQAEAEVLKESAKEAQKVKNVMAQDYDIDCGPSGKVTCPVCKGNHVIIKRGAFGNEYKTCPYCNEHGILTCEEYNQLLRGELKPKH